MGEKYFAQPSVMSAQQHFSQVPAAEIQRSRFDRSHAHKTTFDAGLLIPIFVDEVLPGDTFNMKSTGFCRLATPLKPVMDNMYLDVHFFFVPYRLVWDNWQRFCGERTSPSDDPSDLVIPKDTVALASTNGQQVANYYGLPPYGDYEGSAEVSALPFRAYKLIWNEWYRDQNLQDPVTVLTGDDGEDVTEFDPLRRGKRHDYFTSCLPWPQKGDPVLIPLGTTAPVVPQSSSVISGVQAAIHWVRTDGDPVTQVGLGVNTGTGNTHVGTEGIGVEGSAVYIDNLMADLSSATAVTINDLRTAFQIQRLLERDARGGTRYIELVLSHFGVRSDDARLQRPEYLGGGTQMVNINPIASTFTEPTSEEPVPQGNLAAVGTVVGRAGFSKSFTEHGVVIGLASVRADLTYQQGIERMWSRTTRYDFYWPALAHLGEQAVLNKEIYAQGISDDDQVFGYQERYAEYRYKPSRITGLFNSGTAASLDVWHLAQDFEDLPALNAEFIQDDPPIDRIIAVTSEPHFLADFWFDFKTDRPMPVYSVPGLIDHF